MAISKHGKIKTMKKIFVFICIFLAAGKLSAQLDGTYKEGSDSLSFSNGNAVFNISGFSGLSTVQLGEGKYEVADNFLLIETGDYSGEKTTFQPLDKSRKDTTVIKVVSGQNYAVQGMLVEPLNASGKTMKGYISDDAGKVSFASDPKIGKIKVSQMGFDDIVFDYDISKDFLIKVAQNDVIEHQTVVFKFNRIDDETLSVILLSDDFHPGKDRGKELEKLEKRSRKSNKLDKRMKKVYVPYERKF